MSALEPFYARHKVTELTCPHCGSILTFLINENNQAVYSCNCGRWLKTLDVEVVPQPAVWEYQAKAQYIDKIT